jgi:hypothetical protein
MFKEEMLEEGLVEEFVPNRAFIDKLTREKSTTMYWDGQKLVEQPPNGLGATEAQIEPQLSELRHQKRILLGVGAAGFGLWGVVGFWIGGWNGAGVVLGIVGLVACMAFTFGNLWRYFTLDE